MQKNYYIFVSGGRSKAWCLARTTVQKDGDFLITGHIGFDSRAPDAKAMGADYDPYYGAPVVVLVLADGNANTFVEDGCCVLENMMLAAESLGLGSVWVHREREIFDSAEGKKLLDEWGLSQSLRGVGSIALGYPSAAPEKCVKRKDDYIVRV